MSATLGASVVPSTLPSVSAHVGSNPGRFVAAAHALRIAGACVDPIHGGMARRVNDLADDLDNGSWASWTNIDLYATFRPEAVEDYALQRYDVAGHFSNGIEWFRNFLVLAPVVFTWWSLSRASTYYAQLVGSHIPALVQQRTQPFLFLWERRFGGLAPRWLQFSNVALTDVVLIGLIICLTMATHWRQSFQQTAVMRRASIARQALEQGVYLADRALEPFRGTGGVIDVARDLVNTALAAFTAEGQVLTSSLGRQEQRLNDLATQRQQDVDVLAAFVKPFTQGTTDLLAVGAELRATLTALQPVMQAIGKHADSLIQVEQQLSKSFQQGVTHMVQHQRVMSQDLLTFTVAMRDAVDQGDLTARQLAGGVQQARDAMQAAEHLAVHISSMHGDVAAVTSTLQVTGDRLAMQVEQLQASQMQATSLTQLQEQLAAMLSQMSAYLRTLQVAGDHTSSLQALQQSHATSAALIQQIGATTQQVTEAIHKATEDATKATAASAIHVTEELRQFADAFSGSAPRPAHRTWWGARRPR